jgi:hypothetical protein
LCLVKDCLVWNLFLHQSHVSILGSGFSIATARVSLFSDKTTFSRSFFFLLPFSTGTSFLDEETDWTFADDVDRSRNFLFIIPFFGFAFVDDSLKLRTRRVLLRRAESPFSEVSSKT